MQVAPTTILDTRKYARLNGPGAKQIEKPVKIATRLSQEKLEQFSNFFEDKANVIISSYKTDAKTQLPVLYLKNTKKALWEKFQETYPNGLKRTTFIVNWKGIVINIRKIWEAFVLFAILMDTKYLDI